ncbi:HNH endonuclease [Chungangia koreensis]|uniref:Putative HNH nuclease YajD n=1 Tax=Chungangia koreensis TaxID=752657 RepID=A0ABV8X0L1_9LACT
MSEYRTQEQKRKFYDSGKWRRLRTVAMERCNNECQRCRRNGLVTIDTNEFSEKAKRKKIQLVVHHIKELEDHPELALDIDNLEVLCVSCHNEIHGRVFERKENRWASDEMW